MNSVAIVGGGITGLTAAFRLRQQGVPVTLYEAGDRVGGVIQSYREKGYLAEYGPNTILETSPKIGSLIADLGLASRRMHSDPGAEKRYLVRGGKLQSLPGSPAKFLATPLFSWRAKLRLLAEPFIRRAPVDREESVGEFVVRRIGREFLDYAINPLVGGVYAGDPARLSVQHAFPKLGALEQKYGSLILGQILGARERRKRAEVSKQDAKKISFDGGLQVLIDALHERLGDSIRLCQPVTALEETAAGWSVTTDENGRVTRQDHSAVLFAGTAYNLAGLPLRTTKTVDLSPLAEIKYPPVASVVLGFQRKDVEHPLDGFGVLVPEIEGFKILGTLFSSSLFPHRAPEGHVTLTTYVGGMRRPDLATLEADALAGLVVRDLQKLLGVRGAPTFQHHVLFRRAIPQYEVGFGRFKALMNDAESRAPGFFLAGNFRDGISLSDSIVAGHVAAERLEKFVQARFGQPGLPLKESSIPVTA